MTGALAFPVKGAVALVTGAARGLGKAIVETLVAHDAARIYAGVRDLEAAGRLFHDTRIVPVRLDVTSGADISDAPRHFQDVTLLVNNAGQIAHATLTGAPSLQSARLEMEVNYWGPLLLCRAFAPVLKANGGGAIVNILSIAALANIPRVGAYSASKAAAFSMTQGLQADLAAQATLVMGVFAGPILTDMAQHSEGRHPPQLLAANIVEALEAGHPWLFPDPTSAAFAARQAGASWRELLAKRET